MIWYLLFGILLNVNFAFAANDSFSELFQSQTHVKESMIVKVNDSDSIVLEDGSRIHLIGVESFGKPPVRIIKYDKQGKMIEEPVDPSIPLETQALYFAQDLLENQKVTLEYDVDALNDRHEKQAYVFLQNGKLANAEILRQGFVRLKIRPPNVKYANQLREAYQEARKEQRGFLSN
jgi:micrococcal nuclease